MGEEGWPDAREHLPSLAGAWLRTQQTETVVRTHRLLPCLGGKLSLGKHDRGGSNIHLCVRCLEICRTKEEEKRLALPCTPFKPACHVISPHGVPPNAHQHGRIDASTQPKRHDHAEPRREKPLQL